MRGYFGHIKDIDLAIWRGAYSIDSAYLNKVDSVTQEQIPFFSSARIDASVEWRALFKGSLVGEITVVEPQLVFTRNKVEPSELIRDSTYFRKLLKRSMPLEINRFEIINGTIRYKDEGSNPPVNIELTNTYLLAQNLKNSYDSSVLLPSKISAYASFYEGSLSFMMNLNPMLTTPTFDANAELKNTNLVKLNDFFQAYSKVDVNKGTLDIYSEVAAKEGKFIGYVKPLLKDLDVLGTEDRKDNILRQLWEAIVGVAGQVFRNQEKDQVATKISFEGIIEHPQVNSWRTIGNVLRNAFIRALVPVLDQEVTIDKVDDVKVSNKAKRKTKKATNLLNN